MADFQIRDLERHADDRPHPYWTARIVCGSLNLAVDSRDGSWLTRSGVGIREVSPDVAKALQAKVRPLERKAERCVLGDHARTSRCPSMEPDATACPERTV